MSFVIRLLRKNLDISSILDVLKGHYDRTYRLFDASFVEANLLNRRSCGIAMRRENRCTVRLPAKTEYFLVLYSMPNLWGHGHAVSASGRAKNCPAGPRSLLDDRDTPSPPAESFVGPAGKMGLLDDRESHIPPAGDFSSLAGFEYIPCCANVPLATCRPYILRVQASYRALIS